MSIHEGLERLFPGKKVYGPYTDKTDGRSRVVLREIDDNGNTFRGGKSSSMSLARAKMSVKENRILEAYEEVDHKDEDKTNDNIDNLQILHKYSHELKSAAESHLRTSQQTMEVCPNCLSDFFCESFRKKTAEQKGRSPCCSQSCSSLFYGENQYTKKRA